MTWSDFVFLWDGGGEWGAIGVILSMLGSGAAVVLALKAYGLARRAIRRA